MRSKLEDAILVRALEEKGLELERLNRELAEREARLRAIFDAEPECVKLIARDGALLDMNPAGLRMIEADSFEQVAGVSLYPLVVEEHRPAFRTLTGRVFRGESGSLTFQIVGLKGGRRWLETRATPLRDAGGAVTALLGITRDITERKQTEAALRDSEARYSSVVTALAEGIVLQGHDGRILAANQSAERILGLSLEQMAGRTSLDPRWRAVHEDGSPFPGDTHPAMDTLRTGQPVLGAIMGVHKPDGEPTWISINSQPIFQPGERLPSAVVTSFTDITERKRATEALRRSEERFRRLIEDAADMISVINHDGVFHFQSPSAESVLGYRPEEMIGRHAFDLIHRDDLPQVTAALEKALSNPATAVRVEYRVRHRDGQWRTLQTVGRSFPDQATDGFIVLNSRDVTDSRLLEEQLRQSQKMEAVGQLAGGIAHDFNNLLTVINGTADLAIGTLRAEDPLRAELSQIRDAGTRAAALTRQLLAFSRKQVLIPVVLDLNIVVTDMQRMLQRLIGEHIEFVFKAAACLDSVRADPGQIEQVVMNLVVNARDAMASGGVLTIETRNVLLDQVFAAEHPTVEPGPHVLLSVTDTGSGMDEATCKRVFEPFFSTKGPAQGTGLGLSTVYGIVKQSGGTIWVSSEPGRGTTFDIYLPRVQAVAPRDRPLRPSTVPRGTETILVVEDEAAVRHLASRFLESAGYTVVTATDGAEALSTAASLEGQMHLLLTDVVMPGMSGWELAAQLESIRPRMKVLYTSGYPDDAFLRHGVADTTGHFLAKPYTLDQLTRKVREVLDCSM